MAVPALPSGCTSGFPPLRGRRRAAGPRNSGQEAVLLRREADSYQSPGFGDGTALRWASPIAESNWKPSLAGKGSEAGCSPLKHQAVKCLWMEHLADRECRADRISVDWTDRPAAESHAGLSLSGSAAELRRPGPTIPAETVPRVGSDGPGSRPDAVRVCN